MQGRIALARVQCSKCRLDKHGGITTKEALVAWKMIPKLEKAYEEAETPAERGRIMRKLRKARALREGGSLGLTN